MKRKEWRDIAEARSTKASDVARQLAFAGFALVWALQPENGSLYDLPQMQAITLGLLALALLIDLLQYFYAYSVIRKWLYVEEKASIGDDEAKLLWPKSKPRTIRGAFEIKIGLVVAGYAVLLAALFWGSLPSSRAQTLGTPAAASSTEAAGAGRTR